MDLNCNRMDVQVSVPDAALDTDLKPEIMKDGILIIKPDVCEGTVITI